MHKLSQTQSQHCFIKMKNMQTTEYCFTQPEL